MGMIPETIYQAVAPSFQQLGVPDYVWMAIGHMETGGTWDPKALGDQGKSFGLFQLYTAGGQGDPYASDPTVLYDPAINAQVAAPEIARAYHLARTMGMADGPDLAAYVAANSGHPGYNLPLSDPAVQLVKTNASFYFKATAGTNPAAAPGQVGGGPATPANDQMGPVASWLNGFMWGNKPDGTPNTWRDRWPFNGQPFWNPNPPDQGPYVDTDGGVIPGDAISRGAKAAAGALLPETLGNPDWWKTAGTFVLVALIAVAILVVTVNAMLKPQGGGA